MENILSSKKSDTDRLTMRKRKRRKKKTILGRETFNIFYIWIQGITNANGLKYLSSLLCYSLQHTLTHVDKMQLSNDSYIYTCMSDSIK